MKLEKSMHRQDVTESEVYIHSRLPIGSVWRSDHQTTGGVLLKKITPSGNDTAKVKISKNVFEILKKKKKKGETICDAVERIILAAPFTEGEKIEK